MSGAEIAARLREKRDIVRERLAVFRGVTWPAPRLSEGSDELREIRQRLAHGDPDQAGSALARHLARRYRRFPVGPADRDAVTRLIHATFPTAAVDAAARADRILGGRYDLLGYRDLDFGPDAARIDWHLDPVSGRRSADAFWTRVPYLESRTGDHKVIWELNRHQHWLVLGRAYWLTGSAVYRERFEGELRSWLSANPPYRGINWASMLELAFRALSWIWALHLFLDEDGGDSPAWVIDLLGSLEFQLDHIARHLSWYFSPNTHLLGEGLALYVAGQALPEFGRAEAWSALGRTVLRREGHAQVHPDGGHAEQSLHYHRYALDFYLLALAVARHTGDPAAREFEETARRMARFARTVADETGRLMTIGDDDGGMLFPMCGDAPWDVSATLAVAAVLLEDPALAIGSPREEAVWMAGRPNLPRHRDAGGPSSTHFPNAGYAVLRDRRSHAIFDVGRHGFLNGGHAHADALSLTLTVDGVPLLIDPGTATYTMDPQVRDRFRSTAMHNTVVVSGRDQSVPRGPFHWSSRTDARLSRWHTSPALDYVEGEHDAYAPLRHRRAVIRTEHLLLVADHLVGGEASSFTLHWHVDPLWSTDAQSAWLDLVHNGGASASIACSAGALDPLRGEAEGVGWIAPVYGQLFPSLSLRHAQAGSPAGAIITALTFGRRDRIRAFETLPVQSAPGEASAAAVAIADARGRSVALFRSLDGPPTSSAPRPEVCVRTPWGDLATDARAAILHLSDAGAAESVVVVDGGRASWTGLGDFSIEQPVADLLHLDSSVLRHLSRKTSHGR